MKNFTNEDKPVNWTDERWNLFLKQRQAAIDAQVERDNNFVPPLNKLKTHAS